MSRTDKPTAPAQPVTPDAIVERLERRTATIAVIGLGYVGLPLALNAARQGLTALGLDIDQAKVDLLMAGQTYIAHISGDEIARHVASGRFQATADFAAARAADAILLCVPTPLTRHREPDMTYVERTAETVARHLRAGQLVVLESTTYPGTTAELVRPILERSGLRCGRDFYLAFSPEREDPGNAEFGTARIPKVVGADDPISLKLADTLYRQLVPKTVPVADSKTAEAVKLTENIFRSVNIALVNELKIVFERMGINIWDVIEAAKTKPFGFMPFYPGPGLGGHCIPIDPFYLTWKAREFGVQTRFIELAGEVNSAMPNYVIERLAEALDRRLHKGLNGTRVLVVGLAYKKNVDDIRESPALTLIALLENRGAVVDFHDPHVPQIKPSREHMDLAGRRSVALTPEIIGSYDASLIVTDHDAVDYDALVRASKLVVDTRNATKRVSALRERIVYA
jgi:UDP-N-acetyl-D-glucosamine dehydrogenase